MATVLITGARRGIGLDVAWRLAVRGHTVYATVHRAESVAPTRNSLNQYAELVHVEKIDILDAADRAMAASWDVDVLINNAALSESGPLMEINVARVRRVLETNVLATLALTQDVVRRMIARKRRGARVLIVGSIMGVIPTPYRAPYGMSKWALEDFAHSLREELEPFGIPVIMITPGAFRTGFNSESAVKAREWMSPESPYRVRMEKAEAQVATFEVKDTASIAKQIVKAVDDPSPSRRYVAPLWQWAGVPLIRAAVG